MKKAEDKLTCFRCGEEILEQLYVRTLSKENSHIYCQATGVKPKVETPDGV